MKIDPERRRELEEAQMMAAGTVDYFRFRPSGIPIRAELDGAWGSFDAAELDRDSLLEWLRSRGGENAWAESVVLILLGHEP